MGIFAPHRRPVNMPIELTLLLSQNATERRVSFAARMVDLTGEGSLVL